jgi:integrase/recombinase XerD
MHTISHYITQFLQHCQFEKGLRPKTLKAYSIDLRQFEVFAAKERGVVVLEAVDKLLMRAYIQELAPFKPKTVKRKLATLKALFNYLEYDDIIVINPFRKLRIRIREPRVLPSVLNIAEIRKIYGVVYKERKNLTDTGSYRYFEALRNIALIEVLFNTGARVSEVAQILEEEINLRTGVLRLKGKGGKERMIQVCNPETLRLLSAYQLLRRERFGTTNGHFFINRLGKPVSDQSIRFMVKRCSAKAGIGRRITPHTFRHSFATLLLEKDVDITYIQHLLGHSSIATTQLYTHINAQKQKQILSLKHPRRGFEMGNEG